jgi:hypothetical protein
MRQQLLFGSSTNSSLKPAVLQQLKDSISALPAAIHERTLLPLLQTTGTAANGSLLAAAHWRRTLHSLGSTAPADHLQPQVLWGIVDLLLHDNRLSAGQERELWRCSPLLLEELRPSLSATLPVSIKDFLQALLVRSAAQNGARRALQYSQGLGRG